MRSVAIIFVVFLSACNRDSSPEGRLRVRAEQLEARLDSLDSQNKSLLDSMRVIRDELRMLRGR